MFEVILIWVIVAVCAFFTGRRFYRQWKAAVNKDTDISCGEGCSCCAASCDSRKSD